MDERARGVILRTRPLTETSLIVQWLAEEQGRIATVAKGARRPRSPFRGKLDLFYVAEFSFARSRRSDLHPLREVSLRETHPALRRGIRGLQQAGYAALLIEQTTETDTPLPGFFQLLRGFLDHLSTRGPNQLLVFAFEIKLLAELGLPPTESPGARLSAGTRRILERLAEDWTVIERLKTSPEQSTELGDFLYRFLGEHLGRVPAARADALR